MNMTFDGIQFVLVLTGTLLLLFAVLRARRSRAHLGVALLILLGVPATVWQIEIRRPVRLEEDEVGNRPVQVREYNWVQLLSSHEPDRCKSDACDDLQRWSTERGNLSGMNRRNNP